MRQLAAGWEHMRPRCALYVAVVICSSCRLLLAVRAEYADSCCGHSPIDGPAASAAAGRSAAPAAAAAVTCPTRRPAAPDVGCRVTCSRFKLVRPVVMGSRQEGSRSQAVERQVFQSCQALNAWQGGCGDWPCRCEQTAVEQQNAQSTHCSMRRAHTAAAHVTAAA